MTTDRVELAKQIFEHSCAKNGYTYDWAKQDIKTVQQWTTVADFVLEREAELRAKNEKLIVALSKVHGYVIGTTFSSRSIPAMERITTEALKELDQ